MDNKNNAMEEAMPPTNHPEVSVEFDMVKIREQAWITGLIIVIELSFVLIVYFPSLYFYCFWGVVVYLFSSFFFLKKDINQFHKFSVYGLVILNTWYVYGLLPWGEQIMSFNLLSVLVQLTTMILSLFYLVTRNPIFFSFQTGLLVFPISQSCKLSASEISFVIVSYVFGWYLITGISLYLNRKLDLRFVLSVIIPVLRTSQILLFIYIVVLCVSTAARLYATEQMIESISAISSSIQNQETVEETKEVEMEDIIEEEEEEDGGEEEAFIQHKPPPPPPPSAKRFNIKPYRPYSDTAVYKPKVQPAPKIEQVEIKNVKFKSIYEKKEDDKV